MNKLIKQAGFSAVEAILVIAVLGLVGFIGWRVYEQNKTEVQAPAQSESGDSVPAINNTDDLETAENALNDEDIDAQLDTTEIDEALDE